MRAPLVFAASRALRSFVPGLAAGPFRVAEERGALWRLGRAVWHVRRDVDHRTLGVGRVAEDDLALEHVPHLRVWVGVDLDVRLRAPVANHDIGAFALRVLDQELRHALTRLHFLDFVDLRGLNHRMHELLLRVDVADGYHFFRQVLDLFGNRVAALLRTPLGDRAVL